MSKLKPPKAIEIIQEEQRLKTFSGFGDLEDAIQLGKEALIYIIHLRSCSLQHRGTRLPSETPGTSETFSQDTLKRVKESPLGREPKA